MARAALIGREAMVLTDSDGQLASTLRHFGGRGAAANGRRVVAGRCIGAAGGLAGGLPEGLRVQLSFTQAAGMARKRRKRRIVTDGSEHGWSLHLRAPARSIAGSNPPTVLHCPVVDVLKGRD